MVTITDHGLCQNGYHYDIALALRYASSEVGGRTFTLHRDTRPNQSRLHARVWAARVWQLDGESACTCSRWLIVRKDADSAFKYSLSYCDAQTTWERMAYMQAQRYWIERGFHEWPSAMSEWLPL